MQTEKDSVSSASENSAPLLLATLGRAAPRSNGSGRLGLR